MGVRVKERPAGSGIWWVFIHHHGKRKVKKIGRDQSAALEVAKKIEAKLVLNDFDLEKPQIKARPSLKEYGQMWLETYAKALRRYATALRYRYIFDIYLSPEMGAKPINTITRSDVKSLLLRLHKKDLSRSSICLVRDVLSGIMNFALDEGLIEVNPVAGVLKSLKIERQKRISAEPLTHEEVNHFLETCKKSYSEHYPFFLCAFRTGMRLGELLGLRWSDIDFNSHFIKVQRSYRLGRLEKPKTAKERRVDMSDQLSQVLHSLLIKRKKEALRAGTGDPVEIVFHRNGTHMEQNYIRRVFKKVLSKAGLREIRIHDIRHTFASLLLTNGESPVYVKEQLGHSSIQMTVDIYGHLIPSANRAAVNKLDDAQPDATHTQPSKMKKAQLLEVTPIIQ
jgi:integrase